MMNNEFPDWINEAPAEEEIGQHDGGGKFIPYPIIISKLDRLSPHTWETQNFNHFFFHCKDGKIKVSGSIEVIVYYIKTPSLAFHVPEYKRRVLSGSASFYTEDYAPNEHWGATVKSLAICNAVMVIGISFGWNLNPQEDEEFQETYSGPIPAQKASRNNKTSVLMIPDKSIRTRYAKAVVDNDAKEVKRLEGIYNFNSKE